MEKGMLRKRKILVMDDDEDIVDLLSYNLVKEGYCVKSLFESTHAIDVLNEFRPDLVILDLMMHPYNGIQVCRMIRSEQTLQDTYIFFLTAKSEIYYQKAVYMVGGDEFVEKIVGLKPLLSKVKTVLKQNYIIRKSRNELENGQLKLIREAGRVSRNGNNIVLNSNEFEILFFLVQNEGKSVSLKQLVNSLWGSTTFMDENTALNYIDNIRRKVGKDLIEETKKNLYRFGYRS